MDYNDIVTNSSLISQSTCDLVDFKTLSDIATEYYQSLADSKNDPIKAVWLLELRRACEGVVFIPPTKHKPIGKILSDQNLLQSAYNTAWPIINDDSQSPTYWRDTLNTIGL